jgi:prepilin signal peptidase PulO-like enzyme (type II secretory pathway)
MDITLLLPVILGWLGGTFVNYAADVLPVTRRFSQPACPHCQTPFSWAEYLTLRACRSCGKGRSLRTWLVLILAVASFTYFWLFPSERVDFTLGMVILIYFGVTTVIDLEHRLILHPTSMVGAVLGLIVGTMIYSKKYSLLASVGQSLLGGLIGFGVMFLLYQLGALVAKYRARKMQAAGQADDEEEALGGGDVYLLGVLGLMVGPAVTAVLFYGVLMGGVVSIILLLALLIQRRYSNDALMTFIPYGPYFIVTAFFILFF